MAFAGLLKRVWIPLVVLAVIACGGFAVSPVRGGFGSGEPSANPDSTVTDTVFTPKSLAYQVFGPVGTVAAVSYFDVTSGPVPGRWGTTTLVFGDHGECFGRHG